MPFQPSITSAAIVLILAFAPAQASEVTQTYKGMVLNANLELAAGKKTSDGVILITHGGLLHRSSETIVYLQKLFKERGYNSLAINFSLGLNHRHGNYDCKVPHRHLNQDAAQEIGAWVEWLKRQGVQHVALLGHSRGGAQTALYVAEQDSALVHAVVLMAPATIANNDASEYQKRFGKPLEPTLQKAQKLVKAGKGTTLLAQVGVMTCADTKATAASFVSYFGEPARLDTPSLIPKIKKPVLIVVAGADEIVIGLEPKISPLVDNQRVQMKFVDGADHFFRDLYADDAVDATDAFLKRTGF